MVVGDAGGDIALTKYTADGDELWSASYEEEESSTAEAVAIAPDDTIVVLGMLQRFQTGQGTDLWIRKYAP